MNALITILLLPVAILHALAVRADAWVMTQPTTATAPSCAVALRCPLPQPAPVPVQPATAAAAASVVALRTMARGAGLRRVGGRPVAQARRADLLAALHN